MIELIVIMLIIGILAAVGISRFFDRQAFDVRGFNDQVIATLRHAQKIAVTQRRTVCVSFTATSVTLVMASATGTTNCAAATALTSPVGATPYTLNAPAGVTFAGSLGGFQFDSLGRATVAGITQTQTLQVISMPAFTIEGETGYVHP